MQKIKYSILLPTRNGIKYLPSCVESIIHQNYTDYELIISNNYSNDSTEDYLNTLTHHCVKVVKPPKELSMVDHFEWILSLAKGEWIITLGDDDGLQPYFFDLVEYLTRYADYKKIRTITSRRAYFFWKGCDTLYGKTAVRFLASSRINIKKTKKVAFNVLLNFLSYNDLPQCYTNSLFKRDLLMQAKEMQDGLFFKSITPDANLAAIAFSLEKKFIESDIPLGWIGSSPKSTGFSFSTNTKNKEKENKINSDNARSSEDFLKLLKISKRSYHELAGDLKLCSNSILFWEALLQTKVLRGPFLNFVLFSKLLRSFIFGGVLLEISKANADVDTKFFRTNELNKIIELNKCNPKVVFFCSKMIYFYLLIKKIKDSKLFKYFQSYKRKILYKIGKENKVLSYDYNIDWTDNFNIDIIDISKIINESIKKIKLINNLKNKYTI